MVYKIFCLLVWLLPLQAFAVSSISLQISSRVLPLNTPVQLVVLVQSEDSPIDEAPIDKQLAQLPSYFRLEKSGSSSSSRFINGKSNYSLQLSYRLSLVSPPPQKNINIPAIRLGGTSSNSLQLTYSPPQKSSSSLEEFAQSGNDQGIFVKLELDRQEIYVNEVVILSLQIVSKDPHKINYSDIQIPESHKNTLSFERQSFVSGNTSLPGIVGKIALVPTKASDYAIPPILVTGENVRTGVTSQVLSNALSLKVKPLPQGYLIGARKIALEASNSQRQNLKLGDVLQQTLHFDIFHTLPITLPLGLIQEQSTDDFELYVEEEPAKLISPETANPVVRKTFHLTYYLKKQGKLSIPPQGLRWWDSLAEKGRFIASQPLELEVAANPFFSEQEFAAKAKIEELEEPEQVQAPEPSGKIQATRPIAWGRLVVLGFVAVGMCVFGYWLWLSLPPILARRAAWKRIYQLHKDAKWHELHQALLDFAKSQHKAPITNLSSPSNPWMQQPEAVQWIEGLMKKTYGEGAGIYVQEPKLRWFRG